MFATLCLITFSANAQTKKGTVLLGAGSQLTGTNDDGSALNWNQLAVTPRIGYFVQDGLAIGAEVHFDTDDMYYPEFGGDLIPDPDNPGEWITDGEHDAYTLTDNVRRFGVFARYYAARNLFVEVALSSGTSQSETWERDIPYFDVILQEIATKDMVLQSRTSSSNVRLGMGYTLVWREHFAVEPFVHLDLIVDGEEVTPGEGAMQNAETVDISGSEFIAGVNFSLFF